MSAAAACQFRPSVRRFIAPLGLQINREELHARAAANLAAHDANLAAAKAAGDPEGIRIAEQGAARCRHVLNLTQERGQI